MLSIAVDHGAQRFVAVVLVSIMCASAMFVAAAAAQPSIVSGAEAPCTMYADPAGNDANSGMTQAQPKRSPIALLEALPAGGVGCLKDGAQFNLAIGAGITSTGGTPAQPKTLRPATPGQRATISAQLWFQTASHDIVLRDLNLTRATNTGGGSMFLLDGDRIVLDGVDVSYPSNICLDIGMDPRVKVNGVLINTDPSEDIVIRNSRIHDCGYLHEKDEPNSSGVHGIYVEFTRRLLIENNLIYRNNNRGIQLYPDVDGSIIRNNILHANGANLNIGSHYDSGTYSQNNVIENNILNNSYLSWNRNNIPDSDRYTGDNHEVLGNFPQQPPQGVVYNNHVDSNCIRNATFPANLYAGDWGFTHVGNVENQDPQFANPGGHLDRAALPIPDFTMPANSPCADMGPQSLDGNAEVTLPAPVTDNYKRCYDGEGWEGPGWTAQRKTTWFQLGRTIQVDGVNYWPTSTPAFGAQRVHVGSYSLPLTGPNGATATLVFEPTSAANIASFFYRIEPPAANGETHPAAFGPRVELINPAAIKSQWLEVTLKVMQGNALLGSTIVRYRYENAIYNAGPRPADCPNTNALTAGMPIEWHGPGGRWWIGHGTPTRLDWETNGAPPARQLTLTRGTGEGSLTTSPTGASCSTTCSANFTHGEPVTVTPTPAGGNQFVSWAGACTGAGECTVAMTQERAVGANFASGPAKPTTTTPAMRIRSNASLSGSSIPVTISWTGTDTGGSGIKNYQLQRSTDGGATWTSLALATPTSKSHSHHVASSGTVRYRVRATNNANIVGDWVTTASLAPRLYQQTSGNITYTGVWATGRGSSYSGGSNKYSTTADSTATFTFTGRSVAFVTTRASDRGIVKIYLDGVLTEIDLVGSRGIYRRLVWASTVTAGVTHVVKIVVTGTPASRKRVDVDAFVVTN